MKIIQLSLFPELFQINPICTVKKSRHMELKLRNFGIEHCKGAKFVGKYGIPLIHSYKGDIPQYYTTFAEMGKVGDPRMCVTFYNDDYVIERFWNAPNAYLLQLSTYLCVAEPDLSLRINSPLSVQIANTYRNHVLAYKMQEYGIPVIPSMSWANPLSFDFCFDGHEKGGAIMVSTVGVLRDERSIMYFKVGFCEMLKRISPDSVIVFGDVNDEIISIMPNELDVHYFMSDRLNRLRCYGR